MPTLGGARVIRGGNRRPGWRVRVALAAMLVVALGVVGGASSWSAFRRDERARRDEIRAEARRVAAALDASVNGEVSTLQVLAATPPVRAGDRAAMRALFVNADPKGAAAGGGFAWIDTAGRLQVLAALPADAPPPDLSGREYVTQTLLRQQPYVGRAVLSLGVPTITVAVPSRDVTGAVNGVLIRTQRLDAHNALVRAAGTLDDVHVLDRGRQVIIDRGPIETGRLRTASVRSRGASNRVVATEQVPRAEWTVMVDPPASTVFGAARRRVTVELVAIGIVLLLGLGLTVFALHRMRRREELETAARRRAERVTVFASRLSAAASDRDIARALGALGQEAFGCMAVVLWLRDDRDGTWRRCPDGTPVSAPWRADDRSPLGAAIARKAPVVFENQRSLRRLFPDAAPLYVRNGVAASVNAPALDERGTPVAAVGFEWRAPRRIGEDEVARLTTVASLCGESWRRVSLRQALARDSAARVVRAQRREAFAERLTTTHTAAELFTTIADSANLLGVTQIRTYFSDDGAAWFECSAGAPPRPTLAPVDGAGLVARVQAGDAPVFQYSPFSVTGGEVSDAAIPLRDGRPQVQGIAHVSWDRPQLEQEARETTLAIAALAGPTLARVAFTTQMEARRAASEIRAEFTARLARADSTPETAAVVAEYAAALFRAAGTVVLVLDVDSDRLVVAADHGVGAEALAGRAVLRMTEPGPSTDAVRTRRMVVLQDRLQMKERYPERQDLAYGMGIASVVALPLVAGGQAVGAVRLHFGEDQLRRELLGEHAASFGDHVAQALERARLADEQRHALDQANRLRDAVAALALAVTEADVEVAVLEHGFAPFGCAAGGIVLCDPQNPQVLHVPLSTGYDSATYGGWRSFERNADTPAGAAIVTGAPLYLRDRAEVAARFPVVLETQEWHGHEALAVIPLLDGAECFGALSLAYREPRTFVATERALLERYGDSVARALMRARTTALEHEIVATLQRQLLPARVPAVAGAAVAARYLPAPVGLAVGGDWYDVIPLSWRRTALVVGDVVGKGANAAATMGQLRTAVRTAALDATPAGVIAALDRVAEQLGEDVLATLAYCVFDALDHSLSYCSAGHCPIVLVHDDGVVEWLFSNGPPVGASFGRTRHGETRSMTTSTRALLFTDGLVERRDEPIDDGFARLAQVLLDARGRSPEATADRVLGALVGSTVQADDVALLVADLEGAPPPLDALVPARLDEIARLRRRLRKWLKASFVDETAASDVVAATSEALANAVEHGSASADASVRVRACHRDGAVEVMVSDQGNFAAAASDPDRGRGLVIIRALMDEVEFTPSLVGTTVRMCRRLAEPVPAYSSIA